MNAFTLFGTIVVNNDAANKAIADTSKQARNASSNMGQAFDKIGKAAVACGKAIATGLAAGAAALGTLMKASIGEYAEYEQLVGGVKKLFGDSSKEIMKFANEAYKTAGLSANEYMQTVTSFSASLIAGLGGDTEAAAKIADMAIKDMADNANTFGTSMSSIQDAYQGFAKQNYTMLDNLKLGYGGTNEEMARLINDSGVLGKAITVTGKTINQVSFDKIIQAINVIQNKMQITGTTSKEAGETIAGSFSMFKASWKNLLTGLANEDADMDTLIEQFIGSTETLGKNVAKVFPRLRKTVGQLASRAMEEVRTRISSAWNNTIWPYIREQMLLRFGIDLPDWETVRERVSEWWQTAQPILDNTCQWYLKFMGISEWTVEDTNALIDKMVEIGKASIERLSEWASSIGNMELFGGEGNSIDLAEGTRNATQTVRDWASNSWNRTWQPASTTWGFYGRALDVGLDFVEDRTGVSLADAMGSAAATISGWFSPDTEENLQRELDNTNLTVEVDVVPTQRQSWWSRTTNWFGGLFGGGADGSHANGLDYVPFDGYRAILHRGESVLTASEAAAWRGGSNNREMASMVAAAVRDAVGGIQFNVSLDSGILVGQLAPGIDRQLGSIASRKGRG